MANTFPPTNDAFAEQLPVVLIAERFVSPFATLRRLDMPDDLCGIAPGSQLDAIIVDEFGNQYRCARITPPPSGRAGNRIEFAPMATNAQARLWLFVIDTRNAGGEVSPALVAALLRHGRKLGGRPPINLIWDDDPAASSEPAAPDSHSQAAALPRPSAPEAADRPQPEPLSRRVAERLFARQPSIAPIATQLPGPTVQVALLPVAMLLGVAGLIVLHIPTLWPHGRLWAEEGVVYLAAAWAQPWYEALFTIHTGYLNFPASGATTLAAHLVPLEYVPLVTMFVALLLQLCPAVLLTVSGIRWLRDWRVLMLALLLITLPPYSDEVWLNTITSQFHIMLAVAIILASPPGTRWVAWLQNAILLIAPISGPGGVMLFPLFVLRTWLERSPQRLVQVLLLLPGVLVQVAVVLTHPEPARTVGINLPVVLAAITGKQILLPLLGTAESSALSQSLYATFAAGHLPILAVLAPLAAFGTLGLAVWHNRNTATRWLFAAGMVVMAASYLGALTPTGVLPLLVVGAGNRYYFAPAALTSLALLGLTATGRGIGRYAAMGLVAWLLAVGLACYPHAAPLMARGPDWRAEVARWRANPAQPIAIWPNGWSLHLAP